MGLGEGGAGGRQEGGVSQRLSREAVFYSNVALSSQHRLLHTCQIWARKMGKPHRGFLPPQSRSDTPSHISLSGAGHTVPLATRRLQSGDSWDRTTGDGNSVVSIQWHPKTGVTKTIMKKTGMTKTIAVLKYYLYLNINTFSVA